MPDTMLRTLQALSRFNLKTPWGKYYRYPQFKDNNTEEQTSYVTCPWSHSQQAVEPGFGTTQTLCFEPQYQGLANFSYEGSERVNIWGSVGHMVPVIVTQFYQRSTKATTDYMLKKKKKNECGSMPIKLLMDTAVWISKNFPVSQNHLLLFPTIQKCQHHHPQPADLTRRSGCCLPTPVSYFVAFHSLTLATFSFLLLPVLFPHSFFSYPFSMLFWILPIFLGIPFLQW